MQIATTVSLYALPFLSLGVIIYFIMLDFKKAQKERYFHSLIQNCEKIHGSAFTAKLLRDNSKRRLNKLIAVFEHYCNIR